VLAIIAGPIALLAIIIFGAVAAGSRYVSLASMLASISAPLALTPLALTGLVPSEYLAYGLVAAVLIVVQHKDNIQRLRAGTERRIGDMAEGATGL